MIMESPNGDETDELCRIVVMGAHKMPIQRVMSILSDDTDLRETLHGVSDANISIMFLPCVATFDSYQDDNGRDIRYLVSVSYHADFGSDNDAGARPSSLLEIFDQQSSEKNDGGNEPLFPGIAGIAIGSGIEGQEDADMISKYFSTMLSTSNLDKAQDDSFSVECIQPNDGFESMKEELIAYKQMDSEQKLDATKQRLIGPGKMAEFVVDFASRVVKEKLDARRKSQEADVPANREINVETASSQLQETLHQIDPSKDRFACRKCRRFLFGEEDLEDPPHLPSQHTFGYHKHGSHQCQSYFLKDGLEWMGDLSLGEGKFGCPKCHSKLGTWHWSGAQCSCGTWVVPSIQVPKSRVDLVQPQGSALPPGTVVSSLINVQQEQQRVESLGL